jgi:peptidoglycan/xylan/chitin deacetylase (PgdA/CDA1 family)
LKLEHPIIRCQSDLRKGLSLPSRIGGELCRWGWAAAGLLATPPQEKEWILFQFYHWVLDDERHAFARQLRSLRQHGDFIGLDDAVAALRSRHGIGGKYFCVTFDDGFRNCFTNAAPILTELKVPAAFFVPTQYIGLDLDRDWERIAPFYRRSWSRYGGVFEFLSWAECRQMAAAGFVIGSHTHSHVRLTSLSNMQAERELRLSKQMIEEQISQPCHHFCSPWGKRQRDFDPLVHPLMARKLGYSSFLTTDDGINRSGDSPFLIRRIGCDAELRPGMLRYSLFPPLQRVRPKLSRVAPLKPQVQIQREPEPVELRKFPYPYEGAFTLCSDIDGSSIARFQAVHRLFTSTDRIAPDDPEWAVLRLADDCPAYDKAAGGVRGFGLDIADSFFLVADEKAFGIYRFVPEEEGFVEHSQGGESSAALIRRGLTAGRIDCFHSFLHYTRQQLQPLLTRFYDWCERESVPKPFVWTNHSYAVTPTGLCPNSLQPSPARRLVRLTGRKMVGPWFGRQRFPMRHAFARYQGDWPDSPFYVNDILAANGLRYVWLNMEDVRENQIALPEELRQGRPSILRPVTMADGTRYYRFERCFGKPPFRRGGEPYLRDSEEGFDASRLLTESNLETLAEHEGTCILYTHWSHSRSFPISEDTIARFQLLKEWADAGRVWVAPVSRLLEWTRRRTFLKQTCHREGGRLIVDVDGVSDPIFGWESASLEELQGLSWRVRDNTPELVVAIRGQPVSPIHLRRAGDTVWLAANGGLTS